MDWDGAASATAISDRAGLAKQYSLSCCQQARSTLTQLIFVRFDTKDLFAKQLLCRSPKSGWSVGWHACSCI
eukprot:4399213-Amphidinium_carterae.3